MIMAVINNDIALAKVLEANNTRGSGAIEVSVEQEDGSSVVTYTITGTLDPVSSAVMYLENWIQPETKNVTSLEMTSVESQTCKAVLTVDLG
jgi:hypothetical protein